MRPDIKAGPAGFMPAAAISPWDTLRAAVRQRLAAWWIPAAPPAGACRCCYGPLRFGHTRCFRCDQHSQTAPGLLADLVAPAAYALKGGPLARDLWLYKSGRPGSREAGAALLALLLVHLHDHGPRIWRGAGMDRPTHACVVPSSRGRAGPHPLRALAAGYLGLPWATLGTRPGGDPWARDLDPDRFTVSVPLAGAQVLLLDDTWTSGASAQSACVALKRAGARSVAVVVLGRHAEAGEMASAGLVCLAGMAPAGVAGSAALASPGLARQGP